MAPNLTDGVPGLEGIHTLTPPSPWTAFALNDYEGTNGLVKPWTTQASWSMLNDIKGLHDKPDANDPRVQFVYQHGEFPLPRYQRGRTITYSGIIAGQTLSAMRNHIAAVRATCINGLANLVGGPSTAWLMSVQYAAAYDPTGMVFASYGIPVGFTCDEKQGPADASPGPYQRAFDLTFRQSDGRWLVTSAVQAAGSSGAPIASGSTGTLTMPGTAPAEPIFTVVGSGTGSATITFHSNTTGLTLEIDLPAAMAVGDVMVVDFGQRSVGYTPSGGAATDYSGYINWANTTWWNEATDGDLLLGANVLKVTGDTWYVTATPAVW